MAKDSNQLARLKLLAHCYNSDLQRLEAIEEAAWYFAQLPSSPPDNFDAEVYDFRARCQRERAEILVKQRDLLSLIQELEMEVPNVREEEIEGLP